VGWCAGHITERNTDGRVFKMIEGVRTMVNFLIYYEIDEQTVKTALRLDDYGGDEDASWLLLDPDTNGNAGSSGAGSS
jgi:U3 small nucleolar RNA-associated protein 14